MKILSLDTSSEICSVAILEDNKIIKYFETNDSNTHSVNLMPLVDKILNETNLTLDNIDLFACSKGPGSFTGIRIGVSTIKAFCDVSKKTSIGVSSLKALTYNVENAENNLVCSLIDAKHENIYCGIFKQNEDNSYSKIYDYFFDNIANTINKLKNLNKKIFFVGNAGLLYKDMIQSEINNSVILNNENCGAVNIGIAAFYKFKQGNISSISPLYLKKSSAEEMIEKK